MQRRYLNLESADWTPLIDIIFQLMIFFLVTMSVLPAVKSAPQVEGNMSLPTPNQGSSEVSHLIQILKVPFKSDMYGYLVLDGTPQSAEFYKDVDRNRQFLGDQYALESEIVLGTNMGLWFNETSLKAKFQEAFSQQDVKVIIRAARNVPYGEVVKVHSILFNIGISKIAWLDGKIGTLKADIKEVR
ncbi:biopolymer transporter ExbD [bacterium]|nr:biopolymer transporter ExbD [bacterium]